MPHGAAAIVCDDSGVEHVPATVGEWDGWVAASATRNYVLGCPMLDWLDHYGPTKGYEPDETDEATDFQAFIFRKGNQFERSVIRLLRGFGVGEVRTIRSSRRSASRDIDAAYATWEAMAEGVPIIDQGVLRDPQHRTYGMPDLLVRSDTLTRIFPTTTAVPDVAAPALGFGGHYVVVDIKYTTLRLKADLTAVRAHSGSTLAYKTQLHVYNRALARLQGYRPPHMFLLGRGWEHQHRGVTVRTGHCFDRLGPVAHNETARRQPLSRWAAEAADWVRRMRREGHNWEALPAPTVDELRPPAGNSLGRWRSAVKHVVTQSGDLTELYQVGATVRDTANTVGLSDWSDPRVTAATLSITGEKARLLDACLDVNRTPGPGVRPQQVTAARSDWIDIPPVEFYVDFETVSDLDDDFSALPHRGGQPTIFMIGCGHVEDGEWRFACFVADTLTEPAEARIVEEWLDHMDTVKDRLNPEGSPSPRVFHWSHAETSTLSTAYNSAAKRHGPRSGRWSTPQWFDFLTQVMRAEPVVIRGAHGFGLKAVTNALHTQGLIPTRWGTGPADGLGAMVGAWWCQNEIREGRAERLTDLELMRQIRAYNEADCRAIREIVAYLRANH